MKGDKIRKPEDLAVIIRKRRQRLQMRQETLSSITGVAQSNLSRIERGEVIAELDTYLRLLSALGVDLMAEARS
ncbi:antitoxin HipB [Roseovarius sp. THAF27]|uniref:helix-turn-helix domain-containing protein n=1 Tax=Roseovarius sp. THAF27 TaxID=2587850 RepID=UPI001267F975|nr:helix-turn-helix transcriptional regulator [Roseovarius sp. THAF27]QFT81956.1 antitoxin HipB [Roseovarius sp. THAF27]